MWMTFDCYGTLLDWRSTFHRVLPEPVAEAFHDVEPEVQRESPTASYKSILRECTRRASARTGVEVSPDVLVEAWPTLQPFPDTVAALEALKTQGWRLGILTNCDEDLFESTRAALGVEIDRVVTAEAVGSYKPALGHFERFEQLTGVDRADWVHAAVSWWHDMEPARELGLRRVWVDRENSGHDASTVTARVPDMASLARLAPTL
jgi:2-haloacid dehalogenase